MLADSSSSQRLLRRCATEPDLLRSSPHCRVGVYPKDPTKLPNALAATLIGISEDIITALSKLRWFFVIARNSPFIYKARPCI